MIRRRGKHEDQILHRDYHINNLFSMSFRVRFNFLL